MNYVELSGLAPAVAARVTALFAADVPATVLGVYERDDLPQHIDSVPYVVVDYLGSDEYGWDENALTPDGNCGWFTLQMTGVGKARADALWALDMVRSHLSDVDVATIVLPAKAPGQTFVKSVTSKGPPSEPIVVGTLVNITEQFSLYVEAH